MASFVADEYVASVIGQDKQPIDPNSLKGKVIGLYFSAHWVILSSSSFSLFTL